MNNTLPHKLDFFPCSRQLYTYIELDCQLSHYVLRVREDIGSMSVSACVVENDKYYKLIFDHAFTVRA